MFASEIFDQNQVALRQGRPTINLQSVLIGNGITDISTCVFAPNENKRSSADIVPTGSRLYEGRYAVECSTASLEVPFQSIATCVRMKTAVSATARH